jgi:malonyl-CoA/methylmalonyl-CoA synthetase
MSDSLFHAWAASAEAHANRPLVTAPGGVSLTYAEVLGASARLASRLRRLGLKPGERLAAQPAKCPEMLILYLACLRVGGIYLPLNPAYTAQELGYFLDNATPCMAVSAGPETALMRLARERGLTALTLGPGGAGTLLDALGAEQPAVDAAVGLNSESLAAILYTSGTTGRPKGAMLSHGNLLSNARSLITAWRYTDRDILLHALPVFHTHGLFVACNVSGLTGARMHFLERFDPEQVMRELPGCTTLMGVPTFYTRLLAHPDFDRAHTAHLRLMVSGSAPLSPDTHKAVEASTGHSVLERYGMTEANMIASNPYEGQRIAGSVGRPLPGIEVRVVHREGGGVLPANHIGILEVRGPNVFKGYWQMPEKTAEDLHADGFFVTGDLGYIDESGVIRIVGREKDLIICGGYNVYPKEVEDCLIALPGVAEAAVFGVPHPDLGEAVVAAIVPTAGQHLDPEAILQPLQEQLARYKQPRRLISLPHLPRNVMGKVQKNLLRDQYQGLFSPTS